MKKIIVIEYDELEELLNRIISNNLSSGKSVIKNDEDKKSN